MEKWTGKRRGGPGPEDKPMTVMEHLNDLRKMLIISLAAWLILSLAAYLGFQERIFTFFTAPLRAMDLRLVMITPFEGFMVKLKASCCAGLLFALPVILWQVWGFVLPALHAHERKYLLWIVPSSLVLFLAGLAFSYYLVLGAALKFLLITAGSGFLPMLGAGNYLGFCLALLLPFGVVFQLPLLTLFLTRLGLITPRLLGQKRKYAVLLAFVLAALLTPTPDVITQTLMALPMILLYEISLIISRLAGKKN